VSSVDPTLSATGQSAVAIRFYGRMLSYLFLSTVAVAALLLLVIFVPFRSAPAGGNQQPLSIFLLVAVTGSIGAFFSSLLRLYEYDDLPKALAGVAPIENKYQLFIYTLTPALIGVISAAALYLIFAAQWLAGQFFPTMECHVGANCSGLEGLLNGYGPKGAEDCAKALIWGFAAGFAERLVPDLVTGFVKVASVPDNPTGDKVADTMANISSHAKARDG